MPKISVIMPSLNVAKYIDQCLDSVISQTLRDIEIIVVDAGSTDGTADIIKKHQQDDSRIRVVHSGKRSYGYQMNLGISLAQGEYISIVETDDIVYPDMLEKLYTNIQGTEAQYIKARAKEFYEVNGELKAESIYSSTRFLNANNNYHKLVLSPKDNPILFWDDNFLWYGMYRRDFISKISFNETPGAAFQDIGVLFKIISSAEKAVYIDDVIYHYRRSNNEASSYNPKGFNFEDYEYEKMYPLLENLSGDWMKIYYKKMMGLFLNRFYFMAASGKYWCESQQGIAALSIKLKNALDQGWITAEDLGEEDSKRFQMALNDPMELFEYDRFIIMKKTNTYRELKGRVSGRNVYIFGAGKYGAFIHTYLLMKCDCKVLGFLDNASEKWGIMYEHEVVQNPADINTENSYFVITNKYHNDEIKEQLLTYGVSENNIFVFNEPPFNDVFMYS